MNIVGMAGRMLVRMILKRGINAGMNKALGKRSSPKAKAPKTRMQKPVSSSGGRRARLGLRAARRFGRF